MENFQTHKITKQMEITESLTKFRNQLKSEIDISINIAKELKSYKDGYTTWNDFKRVALKLYEKTIIFSVSPVEYEKELDSLRARWLEVEENPYADFDSIFETMIDSEDYNMINSPEIFESSLYEEGIEEYNNKSIEAGLFEN
jgi:hypothetical protein